MIGKLKHIEIAGKKGNTLQAFYRQMFNWNIKRNDVNGHEYYNILDNTNPTAGIRHEPQGKAEIVLYVEVDDLEGAIRKAKALGALVRIEPIQQGQLRFAMIEDLEGNPIGITQSS